MLGKRRAETGKKEMVRHQLKRGEKNNVARKTGINEKKEGRTTWQGETGRNREKSKRGAPSEKGI